MACFLVPGGEAVVTTIVKKVVEEREKKAEKRGFKWSERLSWLNNLLWGGVILLALEHIWHGEVVPWPPFLTAMKNPQDIAPMLHEMGTIGVAMAIFVTSVWLIMVIIAEAKVRIAEAKAKVIPEEGVVAAGGK